MPKLIRKDSFWTSGLFLYLLALFGIPLSMVIYWSGIDAFIAITAFTFWQIPEWQQLFAHLSTMGQAATQIIVCLIIAGAYYRKGMYDWTRMWLYSIVIFMGVGLMGYFAKCILGRPRPKMYREFYDFQWFEISARLHSYPSGHTLTTFAWLACLFPFYGTKMRFTFFVAACIISFGRVGITSHYLADVVVAAVTSYCIATLWTQKKGLGTNTHVPHNKLEQFILSKFKPIWVKLLGAQK